MTKIRLYPLYILTKCGSMSTTLSTAVFFQAIHIIKQNKYSTPGHEVYDISNLHLHIYLYYSIP